MGELIEALFEAFAKILSESNISGRAVFWFIFLMITIPLGIYLYNIQG
jgi:hypothetical protein